MEGICSVRSMNRMAPICWKSRAQGADFGLNLKRTMFLCWAFCIFWAPPLLGSSAERDSSARRVWEAQFQTWVTHIDATINLEQAEFQNSSHKSHHDVLSQDLLDAEKNKSQIVVSQDGTGNFSTIADAIRSIPDANEKRVIILIKPGIYREKIVVPKSKPFVTIQGSGSWGTRISWNATASDRNLSDHEAILRTFNSATVAVNAKYFIARDITFENSAPIPRPGEDGKQAVALRISADMAAFYNCSFIGGQDTLYDHKGRHYFRNCFVQGTVDFIFGYGRSLYKECHLNSIASSIGSITAQRRSNDYTNSGFSFVNCTITGSGNIFLGRAWGDRSRVVYSYTYMDMAVVPEGWQNWNHPERDRTVFYGQYKCRGPGAITDERVAWAKVLTFAEARPFLDTGFIHGRSWLLSAS